MKKEKGDMKDIGQVFRKHEKSLYEGWVANQLASGTFRPDLMKEGQLREQSQQFLQALLPALDGGFTGEVSGEAAADVRDVLGDLSRTRAQAGFTPTETATFVLSLKQPAFDILRNEYAGDQQRLADALWSATVLLDKLGLYTTEIYLHSREDIIGRQQHELLELSTPVVQLWDDILAVPLVGTLDSARAQVVMETLLQKIVDTGAAIAIIDITGVPTVDTLVAQHLLKTIAATRLMGADCVISGIRPQIAQTIVHLGVDLGEVTTKATLADAFAVALKRIQAKIEIPG
jgi:rsbT co-antagonist protein RsbR